MLVRLLWFAVRQGVAREADPPAGSRKANYGP